MNSNTWSEEDVLRTFLLHPGPARCNNVESLVQFAFEDKVISEWFEIHRGHDLLRLFEGLPSYIRGHASMSEVCSRRDALRLLFAEEIETNMTPRLASVTSLMNEMASLDAAVERAHQRSIACYASMGLRPPNQFPVRIVAEYPHPYDNSSGNAMVPDQTDSERYGIPPGIYFRKDRMSVVPSSLIVAHELVHTFIARRDEGLLARGLEEGLGDLFAFVLVGPELFDREVVEAHFISKRLKFSGHNQRFQTYMDYFRLATWLYANFGLEGLIDLLQSGRRKIKEVEVALISGQFNAFSLTRSEPQHELVRRAERLSVLFPEHEVVSPEAFYLVLRTKTKGTALQSSLHATALRELQQRVFGIYMNSKGEVEFDDFVTLIANPAFRYCADPDSIGD